MRRLMTAGMALALAGGAMGQDETRERAARLTLEPAGSYTFEADLDGAGEFSVARFGAELTYDVPVWDRSLLGFTFGVERSEYDFEGATGLAPGGDPIGGATVYGLSARLVHPLDETFTFIGGGGVEWSAEDGADFGESATLGGFAAVAWRMSDDLTLTLGAGVSDRLEDDVRVIPFVGVEWQFAENMRLSSTEIGRALGSGQGAGLGVVYESNDELSLVVGAAFSGRQFRLDEDGPLPDGVLQDDRIVAGLGVVWEPDARMLVRGGVGAAVWSNIETLDSSGVTVGEEDGDPAPFITASVRILF